MVYLLPSVTIMHNDGGSNWLFPNTWRTARLPNLNITIHNQNSYQYILEKTET